MPFVDFTGIIREAWEAYDNSRRILRITDISAKVSTNHVYRITFSDNSIIIGKLSFFGQFEHFVEDHRIINSLSNNLPAPFENFLARSLMKGNRLFVYRHTSEIIDAWVVFYRPVRIMKRLPRRLEPAHIALLGEQMAAFHLACHKIRHTLPPSSKTLAVDIRQLLQLTESSESRFLLPDDLQETRRQCQLFLDHAQALQADTFDLIPVFVDWNIGNFSVTSSMKFFSRWDYDWFRMSTRMMDFYFMSRVCSDVGDRTVFSYNVGPLMEPRFRIFLRAYHAVFPLQESEIRFLQEAYRFFILNYVIKDGRYFFHEKFARKLQQEAFDQYFPSIERDFDADALLADVLG
jgi:Ser/Thr protein kinase RdoA (MazF antagonist)